MGRVLFVLLLVLGSISFARAADEHPNVVLILIDDLGRNDLGCYGSKFYKTPEIDKLAASGARFTQAYSACHVCSPTRAAIMTGKYPARLHITDWLPGRPDRADQKLARPQIEQALSLAEVTLAERLRDAGYTTGHIGKWHLGGAGFGPREQGFASNIAGDQSGTPRSYFAPFKGMVGLEEAPEGEYLTDRLAAEAEKFIEANQAKPFFLYLSHYAVHIPLKAKPETIAKYPGQLTPGKQSNPIYAAMVESMDDSVGRVLKKLDSLKLREKTIVIFTSDNGGLATGEGPNTPSTFNGPLREGKGYLYEGGIRGPLIVSWPGQIKPQTSEAIASSIDLLPTVLELCGAPAAKEIDGVSLAGALQKNEKLTREAIYWHYPHYANQGGRPSGAIRAGDYKLIEFYETGRRELFNVAADQGEGRNLALEKPELAKELGEKLAAWRKSVGAQEMTPYAKYVPHPPDAAGNIVMPASNAAITGAQLRYEPLAHKNTLGYWGNPKDQASWTFTVKEAGKYRVEMLQGCGKGSGGSKVNVRVGETTLDFVVEDTGHFQNFVRREIGEVTLTTGEHALRVEPQTKPGGAVMDLREVRLVPVK